MISENFVRRSVKHRIYRTSPTFLDPLCRDLLLGYRIQKIERLYNHVNMSQNPIIRTKITLCDPENMFMVILNFMKFIRLICAMKYSKTR